MPPLRFCGLAPLFMLAAMMMASPHVVRAQEVAQDPERLAAAMELIEVTGAKKQIVLMLDAMKQGVGAGARESGSGQAAAEAEQQFAAFSARFKGYRDQMIKEFASLYAERFSAAELTQIASFYKSGAGAKFISAMPELMQKGATIGQKYGLLAMRDLKAHQAKSH